MENGKIENGKIENGKIENQTKIPKILYLYSGTIFLFHNYFLL